MDHYDCLKSVQCQLVLGKTLIICRTIHDDTLFVSEIMAYREQFNFKAPKPVIQNPSSQNSLYNCKAS